MDRRERLGDSVESMMTAFEGFQTQVWTAMPGIIQSFDERQTCSVQPSIRARAQDKEGKYSWVQLPLLVDCPTQFPGGGGLALTFPVAPGDECLVVFANRCIDAWWQSGGIQNQADIRMHSLSDGFVLLGFSSLPNVFGGFSSSAAELRTRAGTSKVAVDAGGDVILLAAGSATVTATGDVQVTAGGNAQVTAVGNLTLAATNINLNGNVNINGNPWLAHHHSSNAPDGPFTTGGVVP